MIPTGFLQELLSRVDVVEIVGRHVELRKAGINHKGLCPFHGEKSPSFIVSPSRQTYHCFGCGAHGDALRFLIDHVGLGFREAVEDLAQGVGLSVPEDDRTPQERQAASDRRKTTQGINDLLARAGQYYVQQLKASPRAIDYLKRRGLTGTIAARFGIGYAPEGWRPLANAFPSYDDPQLEAAGLVIVPEQPTESTPARRYDRFRDRIMFPIRSVRGEVIGFGGRVLDQGEPKYLNSPETAAFVKGRELYGLYEARTAIRQAGHVLVVEGYMDVVALAQWGVEQAVATLGTACTEEHVQKLFRFTDSVVFSFDGDRAGRKAAARALEAALPHASDLRSIRFLFLPAEHDPDSFIRAEGEAAFRQQIDQSVPLSRQLLSLAAEECDLATPEGRARFIARAKPLWQALPEGALRRQILAAIAQQAQMPTADLEGLWERPSHPTGSPLPGRGGPAATRSRPEGGSRLSPREPHGGSHAERPTYGAPRDRREGQAPRGGRTRIAPRSPADRVTTLLLQHSAWWWDLQPSDIENLHALGGPHRELLAWLERTLEDQGARPWSALQRALEDDPRLRAAWTQMPAAIEPSTGDGDDDPQSLRSALDILQLEALQRRLSALAQALEQDPQAAGSYQAVFAEWKRLKQRLATQFTEV